MTLNSKQGFELIENPIGIFEANRAKGSVCGSTHRVDPRQKRSLGAFLTEVDPLGRPAKRAFGSFCIENPIGIFDQFEALLRIERYSVKSLVWDFTECQNRSFERFDSPSHRLG